MASTKKPTGLSIARNGWKYTFSWKIADDDYGEGQTLQYRVNAKAWQTVNVSAAATTKSVTLSDSAFYPATKTALSSVSFRVRGKRRATTKDGKTTTYDWSAYSEASFAVKTPNAPTVSSELTTSNVTTFSWDVDTNTNDHKPFTSTQFQTIRVKASNVTNGANLKWASSNAGWATGTRTASGDYPVTEESTVLAKDSYTRWFRIRSRGPYGASAWKYAKHVYAMPKTPTVKSAKATEKGQSTTVTMKWQAPSDAAHPIDRSEAQYLIDTPAAGVAAPTGANWQTGNTSKDTTSTDAASFSVDAQVGLDECLWVRTAVFHDSNEARSSAFLVKAGKLRKPANLSVTIDATNFRASVFADNESDVPDSKLAICFKDTKGQSFVVGIIASGATEPVTVQCPAWSGAVSFGVYAYQGTESFTTDSGVKRYTISANMKSATLWDGGAVPLAPDTVSAEMTETEGEVLVSWEWSWAAATLAEVSWSTNPNAWESTDEPSSYEISNLYSSYWRVSGLKAGNVYYFRVRLGRTVSGETTYGPYSEPMAVDLSSAPSAPVLQISETVVPDDGSFTASWAYVSTDGTAQSHAEICEVTVDGTVTYGDLIAHTETSQSITINVADTEWTTGESHYIAVRVTSESGRVSAWSAPVAVTIADPISITVVGTSLVDMTIDDGDGGTRTVKSLTFLPLEVTVTGAGAGGTTSLVIERAAAYIMDRPDESLFNGYEGEAAFIYSQTGEEMITIEREDLIGRLDDGAQYRLIATVQDDYGQSAETVIEFEVHWAHQAVVPGGTAVIENGAAMLSPIAPEGYAAGDTCDIYRLSADAPVKIVEGGAFGTTYVDPYPTIGETGGYRFVFVTVDGDYITEDDTLAWLDVSAGLDDDATIIDFDGRRIRIEYDLEIAHSWEKDFTETTYLGGAVQGDWNLSVHRSTSVNTDTVVTDDPELIADMRRLAAYPGICHVRTVDGSTFTADVQVSENRTYDQAGKIAAFSLEIKRVAPQELDGVAYEDWA